MFGSKYLILKIDNFFLPIIFSDLMPHVDVAKAFPRHTIHSAGFVGIRNNRYKTYGESLGLKIKPNHEEDEKIINRYLGLEDI